MSAIPGRRRKRTIGMFAATIVVAVLAPLLFWVGFSAVLDSTGGKDALADNLPERTFPNTPTALYLTVDDAGVLSSVTVFVLTQKGVGGSIVSVPVNSDVGFSAEARQSLQAVYADGGVEATTFAVESLLLLAINTTSVANVDQVAEFLRPFEPFTVSLVSDVVTETDEGDDPDVLRAGTVVINAANAAKALISGAGQGNETSRKSNHEALWTGFAVAVGGGRATNLPTKVPPASFDDFAARLEAAPIASRGLSILPLVDNENPSGLDVVQLDQSEAVFVFGSVAPGSMSGPRLGPNFRVEAPSGYDLQVKLTIDKILFIGANVLSVDTSATPRPDTVFLVPNEADRVRAQVADGIFGTVVFEDPVERIDGIDVTLVLGTDYLATVEI